MGKREDQGREGAGDAKFEMEEPGLEEELTQVTASAEPSETLEGYDLTAEYGVDEEQLLVLRRDGNHEVISLTGFNQLTIGRSDAAAVTISSQGISRIHAQVVLQGGVWYVRDNHSKNGTFVNGARVSIRRLVWGDVIRLGNVLLQAVVNGPRIRDGVFISYGGPDQKFAARLNEALQRFGVRTFFFPESAMPGATLHETMRKGIHEHEKILLVCSEASLNRPGVQTELEETLRLEAKAPGHLKLIPLLLDDFLFRWEPSDPTLRDTVTARVAADFRDKREGEAFWDAIRSIIRALEA